MFDMPPPDTTALRQDSLKTEIVVEGSSARDTTDSKTFKLCIGTSQYISSDGKYNPSINWNANAGRFGFNGFADLGYVGDPERSGDLSKYFAEGFLSMDLSKKLPVCPKSHLGARQGSETARVGLGTKPIRLTSEDSKVGVSLNADVYPLSTSGDKETILNANVKAGKFEGNVHFRNFTDSYTKKGFKNSTNLGIASLKYRIMKNYSLNVEYRNFPKGDVRDGRFFIGAGYRKTF